VTRGHRMNVSLNVKRKGQFEVKVKNDEDYARLQGWITYEMVRAAEGRTSNQNEALQRVVLESLPERTKQGWPANIFVKTVEAQIQTLTDESRRVAFDIFVLFHVPVASA
jgi:hypothetical protein